MTSLNIDVIALIIEHVDDKGTLFSLLTVNRQVFRRTCKVLYRDPFRFFRSPFLTSYGSEKQRVLLLQLLLNLSPAADDDANLVRSAYGVPPKNKSEAEAPLTMMLDYLSFVKCVQWSQYTWLDLTTYKDKELLDKAASSSGFISNDAFVHATAIRMICQHRLGDIEKLEIGVDTIDRYINLVPHLRCLRDISIFPTNFGCRDMSEKDYFSAFRFIQAFQQHHGKDQLLDCRFPYASFCRLSQTALHSYIAIVRLLPPLFPHSLKLVLPIRPMDGFLSRLKVLFTAEAARYGWDEVLKDYSDMLVAQILQRCRSLVTLGLDFAYEGIDDANMFRWAAEEARQRARGRLFVPAVPLSRLVLNLSRHSLAMAFRLLTDVVVGFSPSLQSLCVELRPIDGEDEREGGEDPPRFPMLEDVPVAMPNLTELIIQSTDSRLADDRLLTMSTKLTKLTILLNDCKDSKGPSRGWPEIHTPNLTDLTLEGMAINLFDPVSLHHMPHLAKMRLDSNQKDLDTSADRQRLQGRWTWDWNLPKLRWLYLLTMSFSSTGFSFKFLRGCPSLEELTIEYPEFAEQQLYPIEIVSVLADCTCDAFPNVKKLKLLGRFSLLTEDLEALVGRVLPGLHELTLGTVSPCTATQVVEYTKHHATLSRVNLRHPRLDKKLSQALGLVYSSTIDDDYDDDEGYDPAILYAFQDPKNPGYFEFIRPDE